MAQTAPRSFPRTAHTALLLALAAAPTLQAQIIDGGDYHSVYLCSDGTVWGAGEGTSGQLGTGQNVNHNIPVQAMGITNIQAVAGGHAHTLVLGQDGIVRVTGRGVEGQLGIGSNVDQPTYIPITGHPGVTAISGGRLHSLMLKSDGTVWSFGSNSHGQLGIGNTTSTNVPVQVTGLSDIIAIAAGRLHSLFLKNDGTVWACGGNALGQLGNGTNTHASNVVQVMGLTDVVAIDAGDNHSLFLRSDSTVLACGLNANGQLGIGTNASIAIPVQMTGITQVVAIDARGNHTLIVRHDGTAWSCGWNSHGQLGDGTNTDRNTLGQVQGIDHVVAVAAGRNHSLFQRGDGSLWGCGWNQSGQLGNGINTDSDTTVQANLSCILCQESSGNITVAVCDSYTTPSGQATHTASGTYLDTIPNALGCDSILTIDLTILPATTGTDVHLACEAFTWIDGNTYTASTDSATFLLTNVAGCDSLVTLDLTLTVLDSTVSVNGTTLTADQGAADYQWLDCNNGLSPIPGATGQSFTPDSDGSYAVSITVNGCTSVSACELVLGSSVHGLPDLGTLRVAPNPSGGRVEVAFGFTAGEARVVVKDALGHFVSAIEERQAPAMLVDLPAAVGIYFLEIHADGASTRVRVVKE